MTVARRLARWRVPFGFLFGALALWLARPSQGSLAIGGVVALIGEATRLWAAGHLEKSREVTTSGPYRWTRHPLYVGSSLLGVGLTIASRRWEVAALVGLYLVTMLTAAVRSEETFLSNRFGEAYAQYRAGRLPVVDRGFSWRRVMVNREYRAAAGLVLVFLLLAWKAVS